jgi:hypothetical protein
MALLLLFNQFENMTVETMLDKTQIEGELFTQVLSSLLKSKVLICSQINAEDLNKDIKKSDIQLNYTIQVDPKFTRFEIDFKFEILIIFCF